MTDEEIRLNKVGAGIVRLKIRFDNYNRCYYSSSIKDFNMQSITIKGEDWNPATDLNHNAMVMDTFNDWMVSKQKSEFRKGRIYTCTIWTDIGKWFIGQADTEVLARARAYEKAWEVEK